MFQWRKGGEAEHNILRGGAGEGLNHANNQGRPLTPIQQVCIALGFYGGGHLMRIAGLCGEVSRKAAWWAGSIRVLKPEFIRMPTDQECASTAQRLLNRFRLAGWLCLRCWLHYCQVWGCSLGDSTKHRDTGLLEPQDDLRHQHPGCGRWWGLHSDDIVADWQGANNDARIWNASGVKQVISRQR